MKKFGYALGRNKQWPEATDALKRALALRPDDADAAVNLAWVYNNSGQYRLSIDTLKPVVAAHPDMTAALFNLGTAYGHLAQKGTKNDKEKKALFAQAVETLNQVIRRQSRTGPRRTTTSASPWGASAASRRPSPRTPRPCG